METITLDYHNRFPHYRCDTKEGGCGRLTTEIELSSVSVGKAYFCPCGSGNFRPTNLFWFENLYPRAIRMVWHLLVTKKITIVAGERLTPNAPLPIAK